MFTLTSRTTCPPWRLSWALVLPGSTSCSPCFSSVNLSKRLTCRVSVLTASGSADGGSTGGVPPVRLEAQPAGAWWVPSQDSDCVSAAGRAVALGRAAAQSRCSLACETCQTLLSVVHAFYFLISTLYFGIMRNEFFSSLFLVLLK